MPRPPRRILWESYVDTFPLNDDPVLVDQLNVMAKNLELEGGNPDPIRLLANRQDTVADLKHLAKNGDTAELVIEGGRLLDGDAALSVCGTFESKKMADECESLVLEVIGTRIPVVESLLTEYYQCRGCG